MTDLALKALRLYEDYLALPQDRGGPTGPKGAALQAFLDAKTEALAADDAASADQIVAWARADNRAIIWWGADYPVHWEPGEGIALKASDVPAHGDAGERITIAPALLRDEPDIKAPDVWYQMGTLPTHGKRIWVLDAKNVANILWANPEFRGQGSHTYIAWAPYVKGAIA